MRYRVTVRIKNFPPYSKWINASNSQDAEAKIAGPLLAKYGQLVQKISSMTEQQFKDHVDNSPTMSEIVESYNDVS